MKKIFVLSLLLLCAGLVNARRTSFNLRLGFGMENGYNDELTVGNDYVFPQSSGVFMFQSCISISKNNKWIFAPTLHVDVSFPKSINGQASVPLLFGFRQKIGNRALFVPKIGPYAGYAWDADDGNVSGLVAGPYMDLAFEIKHFVIGVDAFYSIAPNEFSCYGGSRYIGSFYKSSNDRELKSNSYGIQLTFGYKF